MGRTLKIMMREISYTLSICFIFCGSIYSHLNANEINEKLNIHIGHSDVLDFEQPVKRVAIANPEIADATVISPSQILVVGKALGATSMIVWSENEGHTKYRIRIQNELASHQVMLQVRFMELNKSALKEFGSDFLIKGMKAGNQSIDLGSFGGKVSEPTDPLSLGNTVDFLFRLPHENFSAIIKALHEDNLVTLLATPNLSATSGSEASFLAGGEFPIPVVSGSTGFQTVTIIYKVFGVRLKFTPTVMESNIINIKVAAEVSSLDFENGVTLSGFQVPALISRRSETTVELKEGEFLVMGGLLTNELAKTVSKVPVLGHIPVLGKLFSSEKFLDKESELLITLSPRIVYSMSEDQVPALDLDVDKSGK